MFIPDQKHVKSHYNDMLREAAQERFAREFMANQPSLLAKAQKVYKMAANRVGQQLKALDKAISMVWSGSRNSF